MGSPAQSSDNTEHVPSETLSFEQPFVDVVLRSADGVEFHALQQLLMEASHVFSDMFTIPQPPSTRAGEGTAESATKGGPPASTGAPQVLDLAETGDTVRALVRLFHPFVPVPVFSSFDDFKPVLRAWVKYDLRGYAKERAQAAFEPFLFAEPLRVYAFAAQLQDPELTKTAARACLRLTDVWSPDAVELDDISARTYRRLLVYRDACIAAVGILKTLSSTSCRDIFGRDWAWIAPSCEPPADEVLSSESEGCKAERPWFFSGPGQYLSDGLIAALRATPHLAVLEQDDALDFAIQYTIGCSTCTWKAHKQIPRFRAVLIAEVGRRLSEVPF